MTLRRPGGDTHDLSIDGTPLRSGRFFLLLPL